MWGGAALGGDVERGERGGGCVWHAAVVRPGTAWRAQGEGGSAGTLLGAGMPVCGLLGLGLKEKQCWGCLGREG